MHRLTNISRTAIAHRNDVQAQQILRAPFPPELRVQRPIKTSPEGGAFDGSLRILELVEVTLQVVT